MDKGPTNFRMERIEKLLHELQYEIIRGMMEQEIEETLEFRFFVPVSRSIPDGMVMVALNSRPVPRGYYIPGEPKLQIVKKEYKRG